MNPTAVDLYISYCRDDDALRLELEAHLAPLRRAGLVRNFNAQEIPAGADWRKVIETQLAAARVILILVSASYFNSNTRHDLELAPALLMRNAGKTIVIPVLLKHVSWELTPLGNLAPLPGNRLPIMSWHDKDAAWKEVISGIRQAIEKSTLTPVMAIPAFATAARHHSSYGPSAVHSPSGPSGIVPARSSSGTAWKWAVFLGLLSVTAVVAVVVGIFMQGKATSEDAVTSSLPPMGTSQRGASTESAKMRNETCGSPCCGGESCLVDGSNERKSGVCSAGNGRCYQCASGRTCILGSCIDVLSPARRFALRLAHAKVDDREVSDGGDVCIRRTASTEEWSCFPYTAAADRTFPALSPRGPVPRPVWTVGDMMDGKGLSIAIREGGPIVASGVNIAHDNIGIAALCLGLKFKVPLYPARAGGKTEVVFYLDEP